MKMSHLHFIYFFSFSHSNKLSLLMLFICHWKNSINKLVRRSLFDLGSSTNTLRRWHQLRGINLLVSWNWLSLLFLDLMRFRLDWSPNSYLTHWSLGSDWLCLCHWLKWWSMVLQWFKYSLLQVIIFIWLTLREREIASLLSLLWIRYFLLLIY